MRHASPCLVVVAVAGMTGCAFDPSGVPFGQEPGDAPIVTDDAGGRSRDASIDAPLDTDIDTDGDGHPDMADNCPTVANADQRDHDGDLRGDACDGCPHIKDASSGDDDGDGVGNACDPHPGDSKDVIVHFEGFYDSGGLPAGWKASAGQSWEVANGALRPTNPDAIHVVSWTGKQLADQMIDTRMTILATGDTDGGSRSITAIAGHVPDTDGAGPLWMCGLFDFLTDTFDPKGMLQQIGGNDSVKNSDELPIVLDTGFTQSIRLELRNSTAPARVSQSCTLAFDGSATPKIEDVDNGNSNGFAGLRTRGVQAAFDYVIIYGRKP